MKAEDHRIICVKDKETDTWTVYPKSMPGLLAQVDNLEDAPKRLAECFKAFLSAMHKNNEFEKWNWDGDKITNES